MPRARGCNPAGIGRMDWMTDRAREKCRTGPRREARWKEWRTPAGRHRATILMRRDGEKRWTCHEAADGKGTTVGTAERECWIEVRNLGPEIVTIDGIHEWTARGREDNAAEWRIEERHPCGSLEAKATGRWKVAKNERIVATARPECMMLQRSVYLGLRGSEADVREGRSAVRLFEKVLDQHGANPRQIAERKKAKTPDLKLTVNGEPVLLEVKSLTADPAWTLMDIHHEENKERDISRKLKSAGEQLRAGHDAGIRTLAGVISFRKHDPHGLDGDRMGDVLYGHTEMGVDRTTGQTWTDHRSGTEADEYRTISGVLTLTVQIANPAWPDRGREISEWGPDEPMLLTLKAYENANAGNPVGETIAAGVGAEWNSWEPAEPRYGHLITMDVVREWDGFVEANTNVDGPLGKTALLMDDLRDELRRAAADPEDLQKGGRTIRADRRTVRLEEEGPLLNRTLAAQVVERPEADWAAIVAGTGEHVEDALKRLKQEGEGRKQAKTDEALKAACAFMGQVLESRQEGQDDSGTVEQVRGRCSGHPVVRGTRLRLSELFDRLAGGMEPRQIAEQYRLEPSTIAGMTEYAIEALRRRRKRRKTRPEDKR